MGGKMIHCFADSGIVFKRLPLGLLRRTSAGLITVLVIIFGWVSAPLCITFKDALEREVTLKGEPHRIVTLAPSITEILYFLGLGNRVVGVTQFSYYPLEAKLKPKVGSYIDLNVEKIISLAPDLVIGTADGNQPGVVDLLEQAGIRDGNGQLVSHRLKDGDVLVAESSLLVALHRHGPDDLPP